MTNAYPVWSRNLDKNAFTAEKPSIKQGKRDLVLLKKASLTIPLILVLLSSAVTGAMLVNLATANPIWYLPTIVINSDGSIAPKTEFITQDGNVYTLTADLPQKYAIKIQCSNIVFNGAGHTIDGAVTSSYGPSNYGLSLESVTNVTIRDIEVLGFINRDVSIESSSECNILRVKARIFHLRESNFNTIAESNIGDDYNTLLMLDSNNNTVMRNNFYCALTPIGVSNIFFENNFFKKYEGTGSSNFWDNGSIGNYWFDYKGVDENGDGIGDAPYVISSEAQDRFPLMNPWDPVIPYDTVPPRISISSPRNEVYNDTSVPLIFSIYESASLMSYSLDGLDNVTVDGNTTLGELPNGSHNLTVYVTDRSGNGASEAISFSVDVAGPFPITIVIASVITVAVVGVGLLVYFKKRKR